MAALTRVPGRAARPLLVALAIAIAGCANPFEPATPEPPDPSGLTADYSTPAKLLGTPINADHPPVRYE